ncbi:hypothetical protein [Martelella mediterranea]|uniref:Uncharacterized protein n=1 Tax=Martelella mediterranea TaxID=293089 RepID=A0A4R3NEI3_9HYPH|nr:hypothetical protein [Martelella mediterranea]TCT28155.1 hypothetical protein EDC90_10663 [Martelella mediterranea]
MTTYKTGTITLTNGSRIVTGIDTGWQTAVIAGGVIYPEAAGNPLPIETIDSNTQITAATAWVGATGTYTYALQRQNDGYQVLSNASALAGYIQRLKDTPLAALDDLVPAEDQLPYFNGATSADLTPLTAFARSLLDDADAAEALETLGAFPSSDVSVFSKTLLDDANAAAALDTLGVSAFAQALLGDADAAAARGTMGAQASLGYAPVAADNPRMTSDAYVTGFGGSASLKATPAFVARQADASGAIRGLLQAYEQVGQYYFLLLSLEAGGGAWQMQFRSDGSLNIPGAINAAAKNFLIDHPLDPYNKDLIFASTESPHYAVEAWGISRLVDGRASVDIDAASNLTSGTWAALTQNTIVRSLQNQEGFTAVRPGPVSGGSFEIIAEYETCTDLIAWHVVADRADPVVKTLANADPATGLLVPEAEKDDLS